MKKCLWMAFAMFLSFSIVKGEDLDTAQSKETKHSGVNNVVTNKFRDNWFISLGLGGDVYMGQNDKAMSFGDRIGFTGHISGGKWIVPWFGAQIAIDGYRLKGASYSGNGAYIQGWTDNKYFSQKWYAASPHVDMLFNLSNLFVRYNSKRVYEPVIYTVFGFITDKNFDNFSQATHFGLINKFRVADAWDLNLNLRFALVNNDCDGQGGSRGDLIGGLTVGASYKFKKRTFTSFAEASENTFKQPVSTENNNDDAKLKALENQLSASEKEVENLRENVKDLENQLAEANKKVEDAEKNVSVPGLTLYFTADSYTVQSRDLYLLKNLARQMKDNPNQKYVVCGYADSKTGEASYNEALRNKRAQSVINKLVSYGVDKDQLIKETKDSSLNPFGAYVLDRAVMITEK